MGQEVQTKNNKNNIMCAKYCVLGLQGGGWDTCGIAMHTYDSDKKIIKKTQNFSSTPSKWTELTKRHRVGEHSFKKVSNLNYQIN